MSDLNGRIELERTIDSIIVGVRHRKELGDIDSLMESILKVGLLQPVTITPDGVLVCGRRRLEAAKRLGWRTLRVWVRSGISDGLSMLMAQQDENKLRKPLTEREQAKLFAELKPLLAEDAARRQRASRFGEADDSGRESGAGDSPAPSPDSNTSRAQAARLVNQSASYHRLEQIAALEKVAANRSYPASLRELAEAELSAIDDGADVYPAYQRVKAALELAAGAQAGDPEALAEAALARVREKRARGGGRVRASKSKEPPTRRPVRAFLLTWGDLDGWSAHYDVKDLAERLADKDWEMFERVIAETQTFADAVRRARSATRHLTPA